MCAALHCVADRRETGRSSRSACASHFFRIFFTFFFMKFSSKIMILQGRHFSKNTPFCQEKKGSFLGRKNVRRRVKKFGTNPVYRCGGCTTVEKVPCGALFFVFCKISPPIIIFYVLKIAIKEVPSPKMCILVGDFQHILGGPKRFLHDHRG